jgi:hypothetical protein
VSAHPDVGEIANNWLALSNDRAHIVELRMMEWLSRTFFSDDKNVTNTRMESNGLVVPTGGEASPVAMDHSPTSFAFVNLVIQPR